MLECASKIEALLAVALDTRYQEQARKGDHICYISDLTKFQTHYPEWRISYNLDQIIEELARMSFVSNINTADLRRDSRTTHRLVIGGKKSRVQAFYDKLGLDWERWSRAVGTITRRSSAS